MLSKRVTLWYRNYGWDARIFCAIYYYPQEKMFTYIRDGKITDEFHISDTEKVHLYGVDRLMDIYALLHENKPENI